MHYIFGVSRPMRTVPKLSSAFQGKRTVQDADTKADEQRRIRTKEHIVGDWPMHVTIPVASQTLSDLQAAVHKFYPDTEPESLHQSLSKTVYPKTHQVDLLLDLMQENIGPLVKETVCEFAEGFVVLSNATRTRFFLCIACTEASNQLLETWSKAVDSALSAFALETFYKDPRFHVSLLSSPTDAFTPQLSQLAAAVPTGGLHHTITRVVMRAGNKQRVLPQNPAKYQ